jgi:hypothetical protein
VVEDETRRINTIVQQFLELDSLDVDQFRQSGGEGAGPAPPAP